MYMIKLFCNKQDWNSLIYIVCFVGAKLLKELNKIAEKSRKQMMNVKKRISSSLFSKKN